jgi:hypothetical protein
MEVKISSLRVDGYQPKQFAESLNLGRQASISKKKTGASNGWFILHHWDTRPLEQ